LTRKAGYKFARARLNERKRIESLNPKSLVEFFAEIDGVSRLGRELERVKTWVRVFG
jgi:hypothetical protein